MGTCPTEISELQIDSACRNIVWTEFTLNSFDKIVYGYIRLKIENKMQGQLIPNHILYRIYTFFGYNIDLKIGDKILTKSVISGKWGLSTVCYNKLPSKPIPNHRRHYLSSSQQSIYSHKLQYKQGLHVVDNLDVKYLKIGNFIDIKWRGINFWYLAEIKYIKSKDELINANNPYFNKFPNIHNMILSEIARLQKLSAVFVHCVMNGNNDHYDEWIFIEDTTICECNGRCHQFDHRLTFPNTRSTYYNYNRFNKNKNEWIFMDNDIICDCHDIELCNNPRHIISLRY